MTAHKPFEINVKLAQPFFYLTKYLNNFVIKLIAQAYFYIYVMLLIL